MAIHSDTWLYTATHSYIQVFVAILTQLYISVYSYTLLHTARYGYTKAYLAIHSYTWLYMVGAIEVNKSQAKTISKCTVHFFYIRLQLLLLLLVNKVVFCCFFVSWHHINLKRKNFKVRVLKFLSVRVWLIKDWLTYVHTITMHLLLWVRTTNFNEDRWSQWHAQIAQNHY